MYVFKSNGKYFKKTLEINIINNTISMVEAISIKEFENNNILYNEHSNTKYNNPNSRLFIQEIYYWKFVSRTYNGYKYGSYRAVASGVGPSTLSFNQSLSVTNAISGSWPVGSSNLGYNAGKTYSYGTSYSVKVAKGKKYRILIREVYKEYKVIQRQYVYITPKHYALNKYATAYVKQFDHFEYKWEDYK